VPVTVLVPVIFVVANVVKPSTVKSLSICTLLLSKLIKPAPLASNSKFAFDTVVVIKLLSICMLFLTTKSFISKLVSMFKSVA